MTRAGLSLGYSLLIGLVLAGNSAAADCPKLIPKAIAIEPVFDAKGAWSTSTRVWLLSDSCTVGVVTLQRSGDEMSAGGTNGLTRPVLAPDGRWLSYASMETLFVYNITVRSWTIGFVGRFGHHSLVTGWSPDSSRLLFFSKPIECGDCPPLDDPDPAFRFYDPESNQVQRSELPPTAEFIDWMDSDTLLIEQPGQPYLQKFALSTGKTSITKVPTGYSQMRFLRGSHSVIGTSRSGIVQISILTGSESILGSGPGDWSVQWPRPSPSGKRVAYWLGDHPHGAIVVDGSVVTESSSGPRFAWFNDSSLIIDWARNPRIIDASTGKLVYQVGD